MSCVCLEKKKKKKKQIHHKSTNMKCLHDVQQAYIRDVRIVHMTTNGEMVCNIHNNGCLRVWSTRTGETLWTRQDVADIVWRIEISMDEKVIFLFSGDTIFALCLSSGELISKFTCPGRESSFPNVCTTQDVNASVMLMFMKSKELHLWDWRRGRCVDKFKISDTGHEVLKTVQLSSCGTILTCLAYSGKLGVWDISPPGRRVIRIMLEAEYCKSFESKRAQLLQRFLNLDGDRAMLTKMLRYLFW